MEIGSNPGIDHESGSFYDRLATDALNGTPLDRAYGLRILTDPSVEILPLLHAAFRVRRHYFGRGVRLNILNNVQNGYCPEDCNYCAQSATSTAAIEQHRMKSNAEVLQEAEHAYKSGAFRYCVVLSGRGPNNDRIEHMADLVRQVKSQFPLEVCLSAGFIDETMASTLKKAGLDRYNHNLNTAEEHYNTLCNTHTYNDRLSTLKSARSQGLEVCSGLIIGMGESPEDIFEVAQTLRNVQARSIPVNFYVHVEGNRMGELNLLTPERCLRTLCLFRFANPDAEIRAAGGREVHLRTLTPLSLYPANSLFSQGYLNTQGQNTEQTLLMIKDAGFEIEALEEHT